MPSHGKVRTAGAACGIAAVVAVLGFAVTPAEEPAAVEFVTPIHLQTVIGPAEIVLEVRVPPGLRADRVEIFVDDAPLVTLQDPPWRTTWDAGETGAGHSLEAILYLSNGTSVEAAVRTSRLRVTHFEEVALVNLYAVVRDAGGGYVTDLERDDFDVTENGKPQKIERFTSERKPLSVAIVLDNSLTMEGKKLERAQEAALKFLDVLEDGDEGMVVMFSDEVTVAQGTDLRPPEARGQRSRTAEAQGGTALYDAVWKTSRRLEQLEGRRVLVLLSDGRDEASSGLEPGSLHTLNEALDRALRDEVIIFSIGIGKNLESLPDFLRAGGR